MATTSKPRDSNPPSHHRPLEIPRDQPERTIRLIAGPRGVAGAIDQEHQVAVGVDDRRAPDPLGNGPRRRRLLREHFRRLGDHGPGVDIEGVEPVLVRPHEAHVVGGTADGDAGNVKDLGEDVLGARLIEADGACEMKPVVVHRRLRETHLP